MSLPGGSECVLIAPLFVDALGAGAGHAAQSVLAGRVELLDLLLQAFPRWRDQTLPQDPRHVDLA